MSLAENVAHCRAELYQNLQERRLVPKTFLLICEAGIFGFPSHKIDNLILQQKYLNRFKSRANIQLPEDYMVLHHIKKQRKT